MQNLEMIFVESWKDAVSKEVKVWRGGSWTSIRNVGLVCELMCTKN